MFIVDGGDPSISNKYFYGNSSSVMYWQSDKLNIQSSSYTIELWFLRKRENIRECIVSIWRGSEVASSLCTNVNNKTAFMMESETVESSNEQPLNEW